MKQIIENYYDESEHKRSPWGDVQSEIVFGDTGIRFVSTASHGGFMLSGKANRQIPLVFRIKGGAYEEDCDSNIVFCFLFDKIQKVSINSNYQKWQALLNQETKTNAIIELKTRFSFPAKWAVYSGDILTPEAFNVLEKNRSYSDHNDYLTCIEKLEASLDKTPVKMKEGLRIRFKKDFQFTVSGETIIQNDFKAVNSGTSQHPAWRFQLINNPKHWFLANLTGWRNVEFSLI